MSLYRKYRPHRFSQISGQKTVVRVLNNALARQKPGHAYLLTGPRGTGKTTLARVFSQAVNCLDPQPQPDPQEKITYQEPCGKCANCQLIEQNKTIDIIEIDAASHTGVENIRQLKEELDLPPGALKYKVYIIDEVHMLSIGAFNALLKTLEEPPNHAIFILATTEFQKVPETITSRCQNFTISLLSEDQILTRLQAVCQKENAAIEKEALEIIALEAGGGMRDALSLLEKIILLGGGDQKSQQAITAQEASQILGTSSKNNLINFAQSLAEGDVAKGLEQIQRLQREGISLESFNKNFLSFLRELLLVKAEQTTNSHRNQSIPVRPSQEALISQLTLSQLLSLIEIFQESLGAIRHSPLPQLPLEVATIKVYLQKNPSSDSSADPDKPTPPPKNPPAPPNPSLDKATSLQKDPAPTSYLAAPNSSPKDNNFSKSPQGASQETSKKTKEPANPTEPAKPSLHQKNIPPATVNHQQAKNQPGESSTPPNPEKINSENSKSLPFQAVLESWNSILKQVATHKFSAGGSLANCAPFGLDKQNQLLIRAPREFIRKQLSNPENSKLITAALEKNLRVSPIKISFFLPAEQKNLEIITDDQVMANQKIIHQALRIFGGKLISSTLEEEWEKED